MAPGIIFIFIRICIDSLRNSNFQIFNQSKLVFLSINLTKIKIIREHRIIIRIKKKLVIVSIGIANFNSHGCGVALDF